MAVFAHLESPQPAESAWLSAAIPELLSRYLAAGEDLRVTPVETVNMARQELSRDDSGPVSSDALGRLGELLDVDFVVRSSFQISDGAERRLRLTLSTRGVANGRAIEPISVTRPQAELFDLTSEAGSFLRERLGVRKIGFSDQRALRAANPSSIDALRHYFDGLESFRGLDLSAARDALSRAVEIDPDYALAHAALSSVWSTLGDDPKARSHAARAYELASGLPPADRLRIEGRHFEASAEWPRAVHAYGRLWRLTPGGVDCGLRLAEAQIMSGKGEDALATLSELRARSMLARRDPRIDLAEAAAANLLANHRLQLTAAKNAVDKAEARDAPLQIANARRSLGEAHYQLQEFERAQEALEQSRQLFEKIGDRRSIAKILSWLADIRFSQGDPAAAVDLYHQALAIHRETGNRKGVMETEIGLGYQLYLQGDLAAARSMLKNAVDIGEQIGDRSSEANSLDSLIEVVFRLGELTAAEELALRERTIYRELGNPLGSAWSYYNLGRIALASGDVPKAKDLHERALSISDRIGADYWTALILDSLARVLLAADDRESARRMSDDATSIRRDQGGGGPLATSQVTSAEILLELDRPVEAEALAQEALDFYRSRSRPDDVAAAATVLARSLMEQDRLAETESVLAASASRARTSQNPTLRLSAAIAGAELLAAGGKSDEAAERLKAVAVAAQELGLVMLELEARLAWGKAEADAGSAAGSKRLQSLLSKAGELRCDLIARKATAALSDRS